MTGGTFLIIGLLTASVLQFALLIREWHGWRLIAGLSIVIPFATLTIGLITRGLRAGHWPLSNRFEFALCFVWAILAFYLLLLWPRGPSPGGVFVLPCALLLTLWAVQRPAAEQNIRPLSPALQSGWFPLHAGCAAVSYGAFVVAGALGTMFLVGKRLGWHGGLPSRGAPRFPSAERTDYHIWRAVGLGFPWLTLSMLTGAIWAQVAWGRYWDWDPKESWTLTTWLTYLVLLHGRALRGWSERRVAWLAIIGMGTVLFTFLGVGWLVHRLSLESLHVF